MLLGVYTMRENKVYLSRINDESIEPKKATEFSAGMDLSANIKGRTIILRDEFNSQWQEEVTTSIVIPAYSRALIPVGWKMQCPPDMCIKLYPRSGNAWKHGIRLANGTGVVDADFPDEVMVILHNTSEVAFTITHGDRIAQMIVEPVHAVVNTIVDQLPELESSRMGGFGHTGK